MTEGVAEVIAKEVKTGEGHVPTSEAPLAFLRRNANGRPLEMNARVRALLATAAAGAVLMLVVLALL